MTEKISERISDVMQFYPQNVRMPRVLSVDVVMMVAQYLVKALKNPTPNAQIETINYKYHTL